MKVKELKEFLDDVPDDYTITLGYDGSFTNADEPIELDVSPLDKEVTIFSDDL
jgi:hypothetical protein